MKQIYYIIGKHQATRDLTAQEVCTISKPGWCGVGETIETYSY